MSKSENILAFEAALRESRELQEKFEAAKKRIADNKEASCDGEMLVKAAAEVGFTLTVAEIERSFAQNQELSDDELASVAGGFDWCWSDYDCVMFYYSNCYSNYISDPQPTDENSSKTQRSL